VSKVQIIAAIESGAGEFRLPWHRSAGNIMRPVKIVSKNAYRGVNILTLWATTDEMLVFVLALSFTIGCREVSHDDAEDNEDQLPRLSAAALCPAWRYGTSGCGYRPRNEARTVGERSGPRPISPCCGSGD
jgi:hypothetical protein